MGKIKTVMKFMGSMVALTALDSVADKTIKWGTEKVKEYKMMKEKDPIPRHVLEDYIHTLDSYIKGGEEIADKVLEIEKTYWACQILLSEQFQASFSTINLDVITLHTYDVKPNDLLPDDCDELMVDIPKSIYDRLIEVKSTDGTEGILREMTESLQKLLPFARTMAEHISYVSDGSEAIIRYTDE